MSQCYSRVRLLGLAYCSHTKQSRNPPDSDQVCSSLREYRLITNLSLKISVKHVARGFITEKFKNFSATLFASLTALELCTIKFLSLPSTSTVSQQRLCNSDYLLLSWSDSDFFQPNEVATFAEQTKRRRYRRLFVCSCCCSIITVLSTTY